MKKLRTKMILVVFLSVVSVFSLTLVIVYFSLLKHNINQADGMTKIISTHNGIVPEMQDYEKSALNEVLQQIVFNEESAFRTRYFVVYFGDDMQIEVTNVEHIASVDGETAREMARSALDEKREVGYMNEYRFRIAENADGKTLVIFLDCSESFATQRVTVTILSASLFMFTLLITFLFAVFSKRIIEPFEENARRQKQFITDASHELKTPLAIISANAEVLAYKDGGSEWLSNITEQVCHMGELINELLTLSKMEEMEGEISVEAVNLSDIANEIIGSFEEVFKQKNAVVQTDIAPSVILNGNEKQLNMLISILVENASKYIAEAGVLKVKLSRTSKYTTFQIFNTAQMDGGTNTEYLFDRFYRPDGSHTSDTGGHGIGLSIAKKITLLHNGSIWAKQTDGGICFTAELSNQIRRRQPFKKPFRRKKRG